MNSVRVWLLVDNFDLAIDFYVRRLKLFEIESDRNSGADRAVSLNLAKHCKNFVLDLSNVTHDSLRRKLVGKQWGDAIGITLPVDNLEELEKNLRESGVEIVGRQELPYAEWIFVRDPFGNKLSLCEEFH
ncbi:MAG: hypothetical protein ABL921_32330 [Pirellula sp.]